MIVEKIGYKTKVLKDDSEETRVEVVFLLDDEDPKDVITACENLNYSMKSYRSSGGLFPLKPPTIEEE
ncbi:MAG: hypothetical protein ACKPEN_05130 [Planktothrix sp.]|uniref:hypothetical protein n=1 Tax=Planktothrix sp. TaxID=3088171 RepID=UPI0038D4E49C